MTSSPCLYIIVKIGTLPAKKKKNEHCSSVATPPQNLLIEYRICYNSVFA